MTSLYVRIQTITTIKYHHEPKTDYFETASGPGTTPKTETKYDFKSKNDVLPQDKET